MSRTTITIRDDVFEDLAADKPDDVSWSDYLAELHATDASDEHTPNTITPDHIDDIVTRTADEVENRMRRGGRGVNTR